MKRLLYLPVIILALSITLLVGCGQQGISVKEQPKSKTIVNIAGLKGPTSIGMIKMFEEKPSLGDNVESNYQAAQTPEIMVSKLLAKEVDFAAVPTNLAAKIYNKGEDYKFAAMSTWGVLYVIGTETNIKSLQDLKGKTINSIGKGSTPDVVLRYLLNKNGIDAEKEVKVDYTLGQVELAEAMAAGRVKLAVLPEPFVTMVLSKNKDVKILMDLQDEWKKAAGGNVPFAQSCIVVRGEFAKNHPEVVAKFLEEYKKSTDWVNNNASEAGKLVEKHDIGMKAKIAELAIPRCNLKYEDAQNSKEAVNGFLKVLFDFSPKDLGGKLPDENFYFKK